MEGVKHMGLKTGMRCPNNGLLDLIADLPKGIVMAEVGCYAGESTLMFMQSGKVKELHAIDPWEDEWPGEAPEHQISMYRHVYSNMKWAEESFDARLSPYANLIKHRGILKDFIKTLPPLDFVYIDGDHRYEYVKNDIELAKQVVKDGGIIAGHDYNNVEPGVIKIVNEIFGKPDKVYRDTSWIIFNVGKFK